MIQQILDMNNGKKFDVILMNPPYSNKEQFLDMNFVNKVNEISKTQIVIHPAKKWVSNTNIGKSNAESKHLKSIEIIDANDVFGINTEWKYAGIFEYDNIKEYTKELETGNGSIIVNSIQDVVSAIQNQTKTIIDYLSTMNFNNSSGESSRVIVFASSSLYSA